MTGTQRRRGGTPSGRRADALTSHRKGAAAWRPRGPDGARGRRAVPPRGRGRGGRAAQALTHGLDVFLGLVRWLQVEGRHGRQVGEVVPCTVAETRVAAAAAVGHVQTARRACRCVEYLPPRCSCWSVGVPSASRDEIGGCVPCTVARATRRAPPEHERSSNLDSMRGHRFCHAAGRTKGRCLTGARRAVRPHTS